MDRIVINGAKFQAHVGVGGEERSRTQEIEVDIAMWLDLRKAGKTDDYNQTVCYARVHECIEKLLASRRFALIEAVAEQAAAALLESFPVRRVRVTVKKPGALEAKRVRYCGVRITRRRDE